jgi:hypothetical protein
MLVVNCGNEKIKKNQNEDKLKKPLFVRLLESQ